MREKERQRDRETERQRQRETERERQKDRDRERQCGFSERQRHKNIIKIEKER